MFRPPIGPLTTQGLAIWTIFMALTDLVVPQAVVPSLRVNSKKQALQELAARAAAICRRNERAVLEVVMQRARRGITRICRRLSNPDGELAQPERAFGV